MYIKTKFFFLVIWYKFQGKQLIPEKHTSFPQLYENDNNIYFILILSSFYLFAVVFCDTYALFLAEYFGQILLHWLLFFTKFINQNFINETTKIFSIFNWWQQQQRGGSEKERGIEEGNTALFLVYISTTLHWFNLLLHSSFSFL